MEVSTESPFQNDQIDYQVESSDTYNQSAYNYTYDENGNYDDGYDMNSQQYSNGQLDVSNMQVSPRESIQSNELQNSTNTTGSYSDWSTDFNEDDYKDGEDSESSDSKRSTLQEEESSEQINLSQRTKVVREILETEKIYVNHLFSIIKNFLIPLKIAAESGSPVISAEKIQVVFGNIELLYSHNNLLLTDLETTVSTWDDVNTIGDVFLNRMAGFGVYKEYVKNHQDSIHVLKKLEKKTQWTQFLQNVKESGETGRLDIYSFLIQPVQRIPRYELLLRDLMKATDSSHTDYSLLKKALDEFMSLSMQVNTEMQRHDNYNRLCNIEKSITGLPKEYLASPERLIVREGALMKVCRKTSLKRYFFLFSDCLMYSNIVTIGTEYKYSRTINLSENKTKVKDLPDTNEVKNAFQIISSEKSFTVFAENHKEKDSWLQCLKSVLGFWTFVSTTDQDLSKNRFSVKYNEKFEGLLALSFQHNLSVFVFDEQKKTAEGAHLSTSSTLEDSNIDAEIAPVWIPDAHASFCMVCGDHFTVIKRRHHCRNCGKVICGSCSKQKRRLTHTASDKEVRVCLICFEFFKLKQSQKSREEEIQATVQQSASAPPTLNEPKMQGFSYFGGSMPAKRRESNAEGVVTAPTGSLKNPVGRNRSVTTGALYDAAPPPPMAETQQTQPTQQKEGRGTGRERGMSIRKFFGKRNQVKDDTFKEPENTPAPVEKAPPAPVVAPTTTPPTPTNQAAASTPVPPAPVQNPGVKVLPAVIPQFKLRSNTIQDLSSVQSQQHATQSQSHATSQPVNAGSMRLRSNPTPPQPMLPPPTTTPTPAPVKTSPQEALKPRPQPSPPTQTATSPPQPNPRPLPTKGALVLPSKPQPTNNTKPAPNSPRSARHPTTYPVPEPTPVTTPAPVTVSTSPQEALKSRPAPPPASAKPQRSLTVTKMESVQPKPPTEPIIKPTPPARSPRNSAVTQS